MEEAKKNIARQHTACLSQDTHPQNHSMLCFSKDLGTVTLRIEKHRKHSKRPYNACCDVFTQERAHTQNVAESERKRTHTQTKQTRKVGGAHTEQQKHR